MKTRKYAEFRVVCSLMLKSRLWVHDDQRGRVEAYKAVDVAQRFGVTSKTVVNWATRTTGGEPKFDAWAPGTSQNPNRFWLIDATQVEEYASEVTGSPTADMNNESVRLADERKLLEMERSILQQDRAERLEAENDALRAEVAQLKAKVAAMGRLVLEFTNPEP